jgi:hypothetical protein
VYQVGWKVTSQSKNSAALKPGEQTTLDLAINDDRTAKHNPAM